MPTRVALITAIILDRPMCLECIALKALVTPERAGSALEIWSAEELARLVK